ncbi:MAG: MotA/TolQ/ExbB proton channel family protein [Verrucomicrobiota bacterium]
MDFQELINSGALGFLVRGGIFMWVILILGILACAVIIERWRSLKILNTNAEQLRGQVVDLLSEDRVDDALQLCHVTPGPIAAVLGNGIRKFHVLRELKYEAARIEENVKASMEAYGVHVVAALERHLPILATISSVAPMIGFLGTVQGMIIAFDEIVAMSGNSNIVEAAANGIRTALLTTCFGLIIGIPAYMAFNYFMSVINNFVLDVEATAAELLEAVSVKMTLEE